MILRELWLGSPGCLKNPLAVQMGVYWDHNLVDDHVQWRSKSLRNSRANQERDNLVAALKCFSNFSLQ